MVDSTEGGEREMKPGSASLPSEDESSRERTEPPGSGSASRTAGAFVLLLLAAILVYLPGLGRKDLWSPDEPRVAGIAAAMERSGDLVVPRLNGEPFLEKPPLAFWAAAASLDLFGESEGAARLPSALAAILSVLFLFALVRAAGFSPLAALLSGFVLATAGEFFDMGHRCMVDMMLCLFITGAMASFFMACRPGSRKTFWSILFVLSLAAAVLTKGLVGLALPLPALFLWLLLERKGSFGPWVLLAAGALLALVPAAVWLFFLDRSLGRDAVHTVVWTNNFGRFTGSKQSHIHPFYYYPVNFPAQFLPWALFIPLTVMGLFRRRRREKFKSPILFAAAWFAVPFILLSIAAGKRGIYLIPLYPAAAFLTGVALERVLSRQWEASRWFSLPLAALAGAALIGSAVLAGAGFYFHQPWTTCLAVSLPGFLLAALACRLLFRRDPPGAFKAASCALVGLYLAAGAWALPLFNAVKSYEPLLAACERLRSGGTDVRLFVPSESLAGAAVFYLGGEIPAIGRAADLTAFLASGEPAAAVADKKKVRSLGGLDIMGRFDVGHREYILIGNGRARAEGIKERR